MLKSFRKHTKIIIWAVAISFILWGGFSAGVSVKGPGRFAGEAFGHKITHQEFNRFFKASQIFSFSGKDTSDPDLLRQQTWQNILYAKEAKRLRVDVSDDEVRNEINRIFEMQGISNLTSELYNEWLSRTVRLSPHEFEVLIREMIRIQKLLRDISQRHFDPASDEVIKERFLMDNKRVSYSIATFATEEDAKAFWGEFMTSSNWGKSLENSTVIESKSAEMVTISDLLKAHPLDQNTLKKLDGLEPGDISDPFPLANDFAVFQVKAKEEADLSAFTDEKKAEYSKLLDAQKRQEIFWLWNLELYQKAQLKDFMLQESSSN